MRKYGARIAELQARPRLPQISQTPQTKYLTEDHLGTPRIVTNELGSIVSRRDFMPFGEELYNGIGARSTGLQYGTNADDVKQKFTGYLKDNETKLDFAGARMYASSLGRFTAVDPLLASGRSENPQTFNRFVYVGNNPLMWIDPDGKDWVKIEKSRFTYSGRTYKIYQPVWVDKATGRDRWDRGFVYRATTGENKGKWVTLDPWSANSSISSSRASAMATLDGYRKQTRDDVIGGAVRVVTDTVNAIDYAASTMRGDPTVGIRPGAGSVMENTALSSAGISPNENSEVFQTTNRFTTALSATSGGVSAIAGRGLLAGAGGVEAGGRRGFNLALGLGDNVDDFARVTNSQTYVQRAHSRLFIPEKFEQFANEATEINFNLRNFRFGDYTNWLEKGNGNFLRNHTNYELDQILSNPEWRRKTNFFVYPQQ